MNITNLIKTYWWIILIVGLSTLLIKPLNILTAEGGSNNFKLIVPDVSGIGIDTELLFFTGADDKLSEHIGDPTEKVPHVSYLNDDPIPLPRAKQLACQGTSDGQNVCLYSIRIDGTRLKLGTNKVTFIYWRGRDNLLEYCLNANQNNYAKFQSHTLDWDRDCIAPLGCPVGSADCRDRTTDEGKSLSSQRSIYLNSLSTNYFSTNYGGVITANFNALSQIQYKEIIVEKVVEKEVIADKAAFSIPGWLQTVDTLIYLAFGIITSLILYFLFKK